MSKEVKTKVDEHVSTSQALDDEQRVKVLSPGQLVAKRFFRNKLAMVGLIILVTMFVFSFFGGWVSPYGESEVFRKTEATWKDYAGAAYNDKWQFSVKEGAAFPASAQQKFILATGKEADSFEAGGMNYDLEKISDDLWVVSAQTPIASAMTLKGKSSYKELGDTPLTDEIKAAYEAAEAAKETSFEVDGELYTIGKSGRQNMILKGGEMALATKKVFNMAGQEAALGYEFEKAALSAMEEGSTSFESGDASYEIVEQEDGSFEITGGAKSLQPFPISLFLRRQRAASSPFPLRKRWRMPFQKMHPPSRR